MTADADVREMRDLIGEFADLLTRSHREKDRIIAVREALPRKPGGEVPFSWNRTLEFLRGKARRVDAWEKELVRQEKRKLEAAERRREANRLIANLNRTVAYLRSTDPDGHRDDVAAIERTLALAGVLDRPMAERRDDEAASGGTR